MSGSVSVRGRSLRVLVAAAMLAVSLGVVDAAQPAQADAVVLDGRMYIYQHANYSGAVKTLPITCDSWARCSFTIYVDDLRDYFGGPCWKNAVGGGGNWNDCVSSVAINNVSGYRWCVTDYNNPGFSGPSELYIVNPSSWRNDPHVFYNDMISSIGLRVC
jgi:hypothetical protein